MTEEELATIYIDRYMCLLRIKAAENKDNEIENQLRQAKAQLQVLGVVTDDLIIT